jgi:hypothetical protein
MPAHHSATHLAHSPRPARQTWPRRSSRQVIPRLRDNPRRAASCPPARRTSPDKTTAVLARATDLAAPLRPLPHDGPYLATPARRATLPAHATPERQTPPNPIVATYPSALAHAHATYRILSSPAQTNSRHTMATTRTSVAPLLCDKPSRIKPGPPVIDEPRRVAARLSSETFLTRASHTTATHRTRPLRRAVPVPAHATSHTRPRRRDEPFQSLRRTLPTQCDPHRTVRRT